MSDKLKLTDEQRNELRTIVVAQVRDMLGRGEELKTQAAVQRRIWQELVNAPTWNVLTLEKPEDAPEDELWSMVPTVVKP